MANVTIHELRNHVEDVIDRAARGEQITVTRSGKPVRRAARSLATSVDRRRPPGSMAQHATRRSSRTVC